MNTNPTLAPTFLLAAILFFIGYAIQKRLPRASWWIGIVLAVPCVLAILYYFHLFDRSVWYYEVRAMRYTDLTFAGIGFLGGVAYRWQVPETWRARIALPLFTAAVLFVPFMKPVLDPLDAKDLHDRCAGAICLQSTNSTCGPASAATLLRVSGQNVTERELVTESYSYRGGTEAWYLARALRRRGVAAHFVFTENEFPAPSIAGVRLPGGQGHFIAMVSVNESMARVVDPLFGEITVPVADLHKRYQFTGMFLRLQ